jgi:flavin reductase (NADH)
MTLVPPTTRTDPADLQDDRIAPARFRDLMSTFPTGVAVITATDRDAVQHGLTCTSLCPVTLRPPTLLVCLNRSSGTLRAVRESGSFAVNLLHERGRGAAEVFSSAAPDRFSRVSWRPSPCVGQPWLVEDAFAVAECRVVKLSVVGDHAMVLGELAHVEQSSDVPLLYGMRRFASWFPGLAQ